MLRQQSQKPVRQRSARRQLAELRRFSKELLISRTEVPENARQIAHLTEGLEEAEEEREREQ